MNYPNLVDYHIKHYKKVKFIPLECLINETEEGFQSECSCCPWTSGIRETKEWVTGAYYRHLAYILNRMGGC